MLTIPRGHPPLELSEMASTNGESSSKAKGSIKEATSNVLGDGKCAAEGKSEEAAERLDHVFRGAKNAPRK